MGSKEERNRSTKIDAYLRKEKRNQVREVKLLLLGAGESGKSTIIKQIRIILMKGFTKDEALSFRDVIHGNTIISMRSLLLANQKLSIGELKPENQDYAELLTCNDILFNQRVTPDVAQAIEELWKDPAIQATFKRRSEFQLLDSAEYFIKGVKRLPSEDYCPNDEDIIRSRTRTTGIMEISFDVESVHWRMVDVGGQRNERKKWIHCFQDVTSIIFCVATSEYDLKLLEDERVNRMHESIIFFFNKSDLFKEKIKTVDMNCCFEDYQGGCNFDNAIQYLVQKFEGLRKKKNKNVYTHVTCATDTENIRFVFEAVKDTVLQSTLMQSDLL